MLTRLMKSNIANGVLLSMAAFAISLLISFYTYSFLWRTADRELFGLWMAVFEFSQFLLLLDLGFTHSFIKNNINNGRESFLADLPRLRGSLLLMSLLASFIIAASVIQMDGVNVGIGVAPYVFLVLSIALTLIGYADTAALRLMQQFKKIYAINIMSNLLFFAFLHSDYIDNVVNRLAVATFLRSLFSYTLQNIALGAGLKLSWPNQLSAGAAVVGLNASYFVYFMLDGFIMASMGVSLLVVASSIVLKKYFDALRGMWDSSLSVFSIAFAKVGDRRRDWYIRFILVASFLCAWLFSPVIIQIWLGDSSTDPWLTSGICVSVMFLSLYRVETTRLYFQGRLGLFLPIIIAVVIKVVFAFLIFIRDFEIGSIYMIQGVFIGCAVLVMNYFAEKHKKCS